MTSSWVVTSPSSVGDKAACGWRPISESELDLATTLACGQAFRWRQTASRLECPGVWKAVISDRLVSLTRHGDRIVAEMFPGDFDALLLNHYLQLDVSLSTVYDAICIDEHVKEAVHRYRGMRILQQDPWETLITFILSQWSNIPRIAAHVEALSVHFGTRIADRCHAFPRPAQLAVAEEADLRKLGLGYRAKYIAAAARTFAADGMERLHGLANAEYSAAHRALARHPSAAEAQHVGTGSKVFGVGDKVADCVLLFSLGHYEAFPVDVHVRRAMQRWYGQETTFQPGYDSVADFGRHRFGKFAGYAQQYLFHRERSTGERQAGAKPRSSSSTSVPT